VNLTIFFNKAVDKAWAAVNVYGLTTSSVKTSTTSNSPTGFNIPTIRPTASTRTGESISGSPTALKIQTPSPSSSLRIGKLNTSSRG